MGPDPIAGVGLLAEGCPIWDFSLQFYARAGVANLLLDAQDCDGADVNLLLFALWRAAEGRSVSREEFSALNDLVDEWRDGVIVPIRALRRRLKELEGAECYIQAKALELNCERVQQMRMYQAAGRVAPGIAETTPVRELAAWNMKAYAEGAQLKLSEATVSRLADEIHVAAQ